VHDFIIVEIINCMIFCPNFTGSKQTIIIHKSIVIYAYFLKKYTPCGNIITS